VPVCLRIAAIARPIRILGAAAASGAAHARKGYT
jgi:hypothetical protein